MGSKEHKSFSLATPTYNAEIDEAMKRMDAGNFYTHDQVKKVSKG
jgi:hypothetical protein